MYSEIAIGPADQPLRWWLVGRDSEERRVKPTSLETIGTTVDVASDDFGLAFASSSLWEKS